MLGSQPLEHVVRVSCKADRERADLALFADAVEHHDTASAPARDEARERVHQLTAVGEVTRVEEVVTIEEVQGRISHTDILPTVVRAGHAGPGRRVACSYDAIRWRRAS